MEIRPARDVHLDGIEAIYDHYVRRTAVTFDVEPMTPEQRLAWFGHYGTTGRHRVFVAVDGAVVGYASSSPWRPKAAYVTSVETSIYVAPAATGRGIGRLLYAALFDALADEDVHRAYAGISLPNPVSIKLHERFGFRRAALFTEQGRKFGRYWDVAWYEKPL